jgi:hypothetical protein
MVCLAFGLHISLRGQQQQYRLPVALIRLMARKAMEEGGLFRTSCPSPFRGQLKLFKIVINDVISRKLGELSALRPDESGVTSVFCHWFSALMGRSVAVVHPILLLA